MGEMRVCKQCGEERPLTQFHVSSKSRGGRRIRCKECVNRRNRERNSDPSARAKLAAYRRANREQIAAYRARPENRERARVYNKAYAEARRNDTEFKLGRNLWSNHRLRPQQYYSMLERQGHRCAICKSAEPGGQGRWHVDHDHRCCPTSGRSCGQCVRGLLCHHCNLGLGNFKDDPQSLEAAIAYLRYGS